MGEDDPFRKEFDDRIDIAALYANVPGPNPPMDPARNIAGVTQTGDTTDLTLPPPAADAKIERDLEVSYTSGIVTKSSQVAVVVAFVTAENTSVSTDDASIPTNSSNLIVDPIDATVDPSAMATDPNTTIDIIEPLQTIFIDLTIAATDPEQRVEVFESSITKERSDPSLG